MTTIIPMVSVMTFGNYTNMYCGMKIIDWFIHPRGVAIHQTHENDDWDYNCYVDDNNNNNKVISQKILKYVGYSRDHHHYHTI